MKLDIHASFWSLRGLALPACAARLRTAGCVGAEARVPLDNTVRQTFAAWLRDEDFRYIATILSGGDVIPAQSWTPAQHLQYIERLLDLAGPLAPRLVNVLAGNDRWPLAQQIEFFGRAHQLGRASGFDIVFETHRASSLYSPWVTLEVARQLPELRFTLDISHWVVVCERLLDSPEDAAALEPFWQRVAHVQARVGYAQGPQVPHPAAPEYATALRWHQCVWERIWHCQRARGVEVATLTPEFGPDGYLHHLPFTDAPVADLWALNHWMALEERRHFDLWSKHTTTGALA